MTDLLTALAACLAPLAILWWLASRRSMERCAGEVRKHAWASSHHHLVRSFIGLDADGRERHAVRMRCMRCGAVSPVAGVMTGLKTPPTAALRLKYGFTEDAGMTEKRTVGRIGYALRSNPAHLAFRDFDRVEIDLVAGLVRFERKNESSNLAISALETLIVNLPDQRPGAQNFLIKP